MVVEQSFDLFLSYGIVIRNQFTVVHGILWYVPPQRSLRARWPDILGMRIRLEGRDKTGRQFIGIWVLLRFDLEYHQANRLRWTLNSPTFLFAYQ